MNRAYCLLKAMESIKKLEKYLKDKVLFNFYNQFVKEGRKIENLA